jgi:hypothetical protein
MTQYNQLAIRNVHSTAATIKYSHDTSTYKIYDKDDNLISIDLDKVKEEDARLRVEYDSQEYARNRKTEYDALNQLELISDDDVNGTTTHKDAIAAIKTKYPKG